jgi:hypothetical protein
MQGEYQEGRQSAIDGWLARCPGEMWHTVRDALFIASCFREYVALGRVCKLWRRLTHRMFRTWLCKHSGTTECCLFPGSGNEIGFVKNHVSGESSNNVV